MNKVVTEAHTYHFSSIEAHNNSFSLSMINEEIDLNILPSLTSRSHGLTSVVENKNRFYLFIINNWNTSYGYKYKY
jgi:hypothetical protein